MTLQPKICLFAIELFEGHGIKVDRAELLSLSIVGSRTNLKGLIHLILIKFICETISVLFMNITIHSLISVLRPFNTF